MTPTWRTNVVGALLVILVSVRVWLRPDSLFDADTIAILSTGCGLILGTDKLLGK